MQWGLCVAWFYIEVTSPKRVEFHLLVFCEMPAWMLIYYVGERALVSSLSSLEICELPCIVAFLAAWSAVFLPLIPWWAGTHLSWIAMCGHFLLIRLTALWKVSRR